MSDVKQRGRKVDPNSARQQKLARKASGVTLQRGRAADPNSARQQKLARKVSGVVGKRGRPAKSAVENV